MDENQDLAKQYQDILDRYSRELASTDNTPNTPPTPPVESIAPPEPQVAIPRVTPPPVVNSFSSPVAPVDPPLITPPSNKSNLFKYLFFISLIVFLGVFAAIIYTISKSANLTSTANIAPTPISEVIDTSPTISQDKMCAVNDKQYKIGESFISDDGCNTCSCGADLTIVCTQKACDATPSTKLVPTLKPTSAPKATPTVAFLVPKKQTLPSELVSVVKFNVKKESTTSVTDSQIIIGDSVLTGNFASVAYNIENSGGAVYWLTKVSGSWQVVAGGQEPPACSVLAKYDFPKGFSCNQ